MTLIDKLVLMGYENKNAKSLIMAGMVLVNNEPILIGSYKINDDDDIRIKETKKWVSRGAFKLIAAIEDFKINVKGKVCLDIGSSTGGFTQVLLKKEAKKIYALDSGKNQLDYSLRTNPIIVSLEQTNLKNINENLFKEKIEIVVCDVSFISIKNVFDVLNNQNILATKNNIIILIKPQFEAKREIVEKGGYVDKKYHKEIIDNLIEYAANKGLTFNKILDSPILGNKSKNIEYLAWFQKEIKNE